MSPTRTTPLDEVTTEQLRLAGLALVSAAAFVVLFLVSVHTTGGRGIDGDVRAWTVHELAPLQPFGDVVRTTLPLALAALAAVLAVIALGRRRVAPVVAAGSVVVVSVLLARLLRDHLPRPPVGQGLNGEAVVNTFPSGHVAAAASLLVAVLVLWPRRRVPRTVRILAAIILLASAFGSVVTHAHRPGDVLGSLLLVGAVAAGVLLVVRGLAPASVGAVGSARSPRRRRA
ncbi:phosphatase PAP2 family protein [Isoptericola sp. AK164]|uniref:phosphatase PAP2 family protein n=1 Tax=Isoptericola sp. AK164 TaxID=3024246 RepID=UPI0024187E8F|nr:phosphatase PAP2 family protein [Isoptericola sp. AK164]